MSICSYYLTPDEADFFKVSTHPSENSFECVLSYTDSSQLVKYCFSLEHTKKVYAVRFFDMDDFINDRPDYAMEIQD